MLNCFNYFSVTNKIIPDCKKREKFAHVFATKKITRTGLNEIYFFG